MRKFIYKYKYFILGGGILLFIILSFIFLYFKFFKSNSVSKIDYLDSNIVVSEDIIKQDEEDNNEEVVVNKYFVDIKGYVNNPGVYEVLESERVNDVINKAGGLCDNADTSYINLSKKVSDEMVIIIYSKEDVKNYKDTVSKQEEVINLIKDNDNISNDSLIIDVDDNDNLDDDSSDELISINESDISLLIKIPGIGESKAKKIIEYREKNGLFKDISEIKNVSGIGDSLFEKIKDYIKL